MVLKNTFGWELKLKMKTELKYSIFLSVFTLVYLTIEFYCGFQTKFIGYHTIVTYAIIIPYIVIAMQGMTEKKREFGGKLSNRRAFRSGMTIGIITAILSPIVVVIFIKFINPNFFADSIDYAVSTKKSTQSQAENYFNLKNYLFRSAIGSLINGLIISIVASIFLVKKE